MQQPILRVLAACAALLCAACSVTSNRQLSPDREPAAPRHILAADTMAPVDSVKY